MAGLILECDLGNSRCKWRLRDADRVVSRGVASLEDGFRGLPLDPRCNRIRVASVAHPEPETELRRRLSALPVAPEFAASAPQSAGVRNAYGDAYARLGVDRWLARVAGYRQVEGAVLVLDAGSALTADLVDACGEHLGGYILPGARMMHSSLLEATGRVRFVPGEAAEQGLDFGKDTAAAVHAGVLAAQVGAAQVAIAEADRRIPEGFAILVTGGGGQALLEHLPTGVQWSPDLVLDGLAWVLG